MSKVTKKFQVSLPKALAKEYGIEPGDDLHWEAAGGALRVVPSDKLLTRFRAADRLGFFDEASKRQRERQLNCPIGKQPIEAGPAIVFTKAMRALIDTNILV